LSNELKQKNGQDLKVRKHSLPKSSEETVSGTTRLNEKLAKRKLSSYLIVQQKRIARLWLVYNGQVLPMVGN